MTSGVPPSVLAHALSEAGYACVDGLVVQQARALLGGLGRRVDERWLEATATSDATPNTLSARYGRQAFPLHTDGAHLHVPPAFVGLWAETPSESATLLVDGWDIRTDLPALSDVWTVTPGGKAPKFYCIPRRVVRGRIDLRLNLDCMTHAISSAIPEAIRIGLAELPRIAVAWQAGRLLVLDNRRMLHGRQAIADGTVRRLLRLEVFQ